MGQKDLRRTGRSRNEPISFFANQNHKHICYAVVVLRFNDRSTFMGTFASHPREREKMDKRNSR